MDCYGELTPKEGEENQQYGWCERTDEPHVFSYGIFGTGRTGTMHTQILLTQCQEIVAVGDESPIAIEQYFQTLSRSNKKENVRALSNYRSLDKNQVATFSTADDMVAAHREGKFKLDAVVICSATHRHTRDAEPFIRAGIKVYIEPPLSGDLAEAFDFIKNVGIESTTMQIGLQRAFDEALIYARQLLTEGRVGSIREVRSVLRDQFPPPAHYASNSIIKDLGVHGFYEFIMLTGGEVPNRVWALKFDAKDYGIPGGASSQTQTPTSQNQQQGENGNTAFVTFTTASGTIGRLDISRTHSSGFANTTEIIGSSGTLMIGRYAGNPGPINVELWNTDGTKCNMCSRTFDSPSDIKRPFACPEFFPRFRDAFRASHRAFRADTAEKKSYRVTQMDVLDVQVAVEAAQISAEKGGIPIEYKKANNIDEYHNNCRKASLC